MYLRLSVTGGCNLRCRYCNPNGTAGAARRTDTPYAQILKLVKRISKVTSLGKIRITGGEPLLRGGVQGLVWDLRKQFKNTELALTTNGSLLCRCAGQLRQNGLDRINVSMDSVDPDRFSRATGGGKLREVVAGIDHAIAAGFSNLKINAVLTRSINGDGLPALIAFAAERGCEIRFIELMRFNNRWPEYDSEFLSAAEALSIIRQRFEVLPGTQTTGTSRTFKILCEDQITKIGFITPVTEPFCKRCDRLRLDSRGRLHACLRGGGGSDLLTPLIAGDLDCVDRRIQQVLDSKCDPGQNWEPQKMWAIGG
jgi:cyclic pyranopterin phosphate synthase